MIKIEEEIKNEISELTGYKETLIDTSNLPKESYVYSSDDKMYQENIKDRKLFINYGIDETLVDDIVYHILKYNAIDKGIPVDKRKPILLYVNSNGGSLIDGFALIDVILASKTPVYTINLGYCYSMGFLIFISGHKRYGSYNATYLMHDGSSMAWNSSSKLIDQVEFQKRQEKRIKEYVLKHSAVSDKEYDKKCNRFYWKRRT